MDEYSKLTLEKSLDLASELIHKLVDKPLEQTGLLLADRIRTIRLNLQIKNLIKVKSILEENSIPVKPISIKILTPYLEGISVEEDEHVQDLWANLFVNYIDASKNLTQTVFPQILKQISYNEVQLLNSFLENNGELRFGNSNRQPTHNGLYDSSSLANLLRLGLIREQINVIMDGFDEHGNNGDSDTYLIQLEKISKGSIPNEGYVLTDFGFQFLKACKR